MKKKSWPLHLNLRQVQNLQYRIYVFYLFFFVLKATTHVGAKALNMRHQTQKGFRGIFVVIPQHQKGSLVYVPDKRKVASSYDFIFDESFSSAL